MKYCTNCGTGNWDTARFCAKCGTQLATVPPPKSPEAQSASAGQPEEDFILFDCPSCGQSLEAPREMAGTPIDCPKCNMRIQLPQPLPVFNPPPPPPPVEAGKGRTSLKCSLGLHKWDGCKCSLCGQKRQHVWSKEQGKCMQCGVTQIEIATLQDLDSVRQCLDAHYVLVADIDASETKNWDGGRGFAPIGMNDDNGFRGNFNGNGHVIRHLHINRPQENVMGLFPLNTGTIRNVRLEDVHITGQKDVGGLVGANVEGTITRCFATGKVSGQERVGELAGFNVEGTITGCCAACHVSGQEDVGGLVGVNTKGGMITESFVSGIIYGQDYVGGLVGGNSIDGKITRCSASCEVSGKKFVGGLVGGNIKRGMITESFASGKVCGQVDAGGLVGSRTDDSETARSYWDIATSGQNASDGGEGKRSAEMKQRSMFVGWDFETVWQIEEGRGYPTLRCLAGKTPPQETVDAPISPIAAQPNAPSPKPAMPNPAISMHDRLRQMLHNHLQRLRGERHQPTLNILDELESRFLESALPISEMVERTLSDRKLHTKCIGGGGIRTWLLVSAVPSDRFGSANFFGREYPPGYAGYMDFWMNAQPLKMAREMGHDVFAHVLVYADASSSEPLSIGIGLLPLDASRSNSNPLMIMPEESLTGEDKAAMGR